MDYQTNTFVFECNGYKLVFEMQFSLVDRMKQVGYIVHLNDTFIGKIQARKFMSMDEECYRRHLIAKKVFESLMAQKPPKNKFLVKVCRLVCDTMANSTEPFGIAR
jgi:hypothetical protein